MNPLLTTLRIIETLGIQSASATELQNKFSVSVATLKRHLGEARLLGADIEAHKFGKSWCYLLKNKDEVRGRVHTWIELETTRDLRSDN